MSAIDSAISGGCAARQLLELIERQCAHPDELARAIDSCPEGESRRSFCRRVQKALEQVAIRKPHA